VTSQYDLTHSVLAIHPPSGFSGRLYRWQQQTNQDPDDGNNNQQFHQSEPRAIAS
jgi:hypothetical protein